MGVSASERARSLKCCIIKKEPFFCLPLATPVSLFSRAKLYLFEEDPNRTREGAECRNEPLILFFCGGTVT